MSKEQNDLALETTGSRISYVSCEHKGAAASSNIIDGSRTTFWATTGLYPHVFILTFPNPVEISCIKLRSYYIKTMVIEKCVDSGGKNFEEVKALGIELSDLHHQLLEMDVTPFITHHLRFIIKEGYEDFCAVYKIIHHELRMIGIRKRGLHDLQVEVFGNSMHKSFSSQGGQLFSVVQSNRELAPGAKHLGRHSVQHPIPQVTRFLSPLHGIRPPKSKFGFNPVMSNSLPTQNYVTNLSCDVHTDSD